MTRGPVCRGVALAATVLHAGMVQAGDTDASVSGTVRGATGNANLDDRTALLGGDLRLSGKLALPIAGETRIEAHGESLLSWASFDRRPLGRQIVRQAYVQYRSERVDLTIGRRVVLWGTGDGFNPTSTLAGVDYRTLTYDTNGERFGTDLVQADLYMGKTLVLTAIALPGTRSTILPQGLLPPAVAAVPTRTRTGIADTLGGAIRLQYRGQGTDVSLAAHLGHATTPAYAVSVQGVPLRVLPRLLMVGGDVSRVMGPWRVVFEGAYLRYRSADVLPGFLPRDEAAGLVGVEYELPSQARIQVQLYGREYADERAVPAPAAGLRLVNQVAYGQFGARDYGGIVTFRADLGGDATTLELAAAGSISRGGRLVNAKLKRRIDDHANAYLRIDHLDGPATSPFGSLRRNSRAMLELRVTY